MLTKYIDITPKGWKKRQKRLFHKIRMKRKAFYNKYKKKIKRRVIK